MSTSRPRTPAWQARLAGAMLSIAAAAWSAAAGAAAPLGAEDARHLLNRTSFAASPAEIDAYARLTREQAAAKLLTAGRAVPVTPPPAWTAEPFHWVRLNRQMSAEERMALQRERREKGLELRAWWLEEMRATPSPMSEKMTLFWHNHFVSSDQKVRSPQLMYRQNALLRRHALGNFGAMLHEVARDPAMVIYLDNASNRKAQPNENFAREVMELFTLGEGHYTEQDVKEAARAFTGWSFDPDRGEFLFRAPQHDDGLKTVLGRSGNLTGDDVLRTLLAHPRTAEHVVEKLWREFVSPQPDAAEVKRVAGRFRDSGYDIQVALRALLTSDAFYAAGNRASLVKSPVELVVGTLRQFHFSTGEMLPFAFTVAQLGQNLFAPPNVKGWPGGDAWINSTTLLARKQFLERMFREDDTRAMSAAPAMNMKGMAPIDNPRQRAARAMAEVRFDSARWLGDMQPRGSAGVQRVLLAAAPGNPVAPGLEGLAAVRALTQDAVYQLK
ncbi:MAG TPA: DUF1800 domain-containing protein [Burkholderiales bacterium]|nr:DUF1800 domain-containing protein [Burkholderiales bacterium]